VLLDTKNKKKPGANAGGGVQPYERYSFFFDFPPPPPNFFLAFAPDKNT